MDAGKLASRSGEIGGTFTLLSDAIADAPLCAAARWVTHTRWRIAVVPEPVGVTGASLGSGVALAVTAARSLHPGARTVFAEDPRPGIPCVAPAYAHIRRLVQSAMVRALCFAARTTISKIAGAHTRVARGFGAVIAWVCTSWAHPARNPGAVILDERLVAVAASWPICGHRGVAGTPTVAIGFPGAVRLVTANISPPRITGAFSFRTVALAVPSAIQSYPGAPRNLTDSAAEP